ncbi:MAG: hypothetical protein EON93_14860 [Burkholderiales bacterium]|nr:MAG: hypothetical protein EON93_14860 [Burkholderiales bacterium]
MTCMDQEFDSSGELNLAERIRRLANGRNTLDVAQFQFIGLDEIRAGYAGRWTEKREHVFRVATQFITRRISPQDVLIPSDEGFLLIFGAFSGFQADAAGKRVSKELNQFFLGTPDMDQIQLEARHQSMSVHDFASAYGEMIAGANDLTPLQVSSETPMGFTPVWDAQRGALSTFFISPLDAMGAPMDWDWASYRHTDMDELKLKASEEAMKALFATGRKALVGVAVHVSSLNSQQSLARLMSVISTFDPEMARYRVIRVSCVEPGFPRIYLQDILRTLKPRIPHVAIGLHWTEPDLASILSLQPSAIGFSLPTGALSPHGNKAEVLARVRAAMELAHHHDVSVGIEGDVHRVHARRLALDGANHLCSPRIWPTRLALPEAELWPASRLDVSTSAAA